MFKAVNGDDDEIDLFTQSDWGASQTGKCTPAYMARSMLHSRGISYGDLDSRVNVWVRQVEENDKHRSSTKSNVSRAIRKKNMSWHTFLRFLSIMRIRRLTIVCKAEWDDGVETWHQHVINGDENYLNAEDLGEELELTSLQDEVDLGSCTHRL